MTLLSSSVQEMGLREGQLTSPYSLYHMTDPRPLFLDPDSGEVRL